MQLIPLARALRASAETRRPGDESSQQWHSAQARLCHDGSAAVRNLRSAACLMLFAIWGLFACSANVAGTDPDNGARAAQQPLTTAVYQINCGGGVVGSFASERFGSGGAMDSTSNVISTTGVANAAPAAVYQSERYGNQSYVLGSLVAAASYTVRLHFAEPWFNTAGARQFNVLINGVQVLTNFDIFAAAGANKALVRDFTTSASSAKQITVQLVNVIDNAEVRGIEILAGGASGQAPTVATAAAAGSNPVTGTTSALSVLGADDAGEVNLTYTWAATGTPPGTVSFSANGSNAAKSTNATFSSAGSYTLAVAITDASGLSTTSSVVVSVNQTLTSVSVTPPSAQLTTGGSQQFSASTRDQFGTAMATQPAMTWAVTGGGTVSSSGLFTAGSSAGGPFTVSATASAKSGTASVTVSTGTTGGSAVYQINCGGGVVGSFASERFGSGGATDSTSNVISTTGVANAAPAAVYQSERYGNQSYVLGSLVAAASYTVRLHFAEPWFNTAGARQFNVLINGVQVLTNFDIFAAAGANKALVRDFTTSASSAKQITVQLVNVIDNAEVRGIEILAGGASGQAPTVATAAAAGSNPVTGTTSALSVLGADDAGEVNLTYTWAATGTPPGTVSFSANGSNAAKSTNATFSSAGSYTLAVAITDASGLSTTSSVVVSVNQTLTSVSLTPTSAQLATGGSQQFSASTRDQFGTAMATQPAMTWAVTGGGTVSSSGLFTAGSSAGGPFTVSATASAKSGTASVNISSAQGAVTYSTNFDGSELPISEGGAWSNNGIDWTAIKTGNGIAFGTESSASSFFDDSIAVLSGFPADQSSTAVVHRDPALAGNTHEVELLFRFAISPHNARGYECNLSFDGAYTQIVSWNGPLGNFTMLSDSEPRPGLNVREGDVFSAQMIGNVITVYLNGTQINKYTDTSAGGRARWTDGNPGIGFWHGDSNGTLGFSSFSTTSVGQ